MITCPNCRTEWTKEKLQGVWEENCIDDYSCPTCGIDIRDDESGVDV